MLAEKIGGAAMLNESHWIVGLWFLPVLLFVVIPLSLFAVWNVMSILNAAMGKRKTAEWEAFDTTEQEKFTVKLQSFTVS